MKVPVLSVFLVVFAGCAADTGEGPPAFFDLDRDTGTDTQTDGQEAGDDARPDRPDADVGSDPDVRDDDVAEEDLPPDVPVDPCEGVRCGAHGACVAGQCECEQGYELSDGTCTLFDPGDPAQRSAELVCSRFDDDFPTRAARVWTGGAGCDPGVIDPVAHEDGMRRLNLYRWLVGLEPAGFSATNQIAVQKAAMMMDANNALSHSPPVTWQCYDSDGAAAAGQSNLALGYASPADSIVGYIEDGGTPSLGHRRWIFFPQLDATAFGHRGRGGAMYAFGNTQRRSPDFVAYPPPGPVPITAVHGAWSFSRQGVGNPTVTVSVGDRSIPVTSSALQQGFGLDTVSFQLGERVRAGTTYEVQVGNIRYETTPVDCP